MAAPIEILTPESGNPLSHVHSMISELSAILDTYTYTNPVQFYTSVMEIPGVDAATVESMRQSVNMLIENYDGLALRLDAIRCNIRASAQVLDVIAAQ